VTAAIGGALVVAPGRAGSAVGLEDRVAARWIGLSDLALVPGLVAGRPRWPWMAARAALNLAIAGYLVRTRHAAPGTRLSAVTAGLCLVTAADLRTAAALRRT